MKQLVRIQSMDKPGRRAAVSLTSVFSARKSEAAPVVGPARAACEAMGPASTADHRTASDWIKRYYDTKSDAGHAGTLETVARVARQRGGRGIAPHLGKPRCSCEITALHETGDEQMKAAFWLLALFAVADGRHAGRQI